MKLPKHFPKWWRATEEDTQPLTPDLYTHLHTDTHTAHTWYLVIAASSGAQLLHHFLLTLNSQQTIPVRIGSIDQSKTSFRKRKCFFLSFSSHNHESTAIRGLAWGLCGLLFQCRGAARRRPGRVRLCHACPSLGSTLLTWKGT